MSSAMAVVPSSERRRDALSWLLARSTSTSLGAMDMRVHSRSVMCAISSMFIRFSVTR